MTIPFNLEDGHGNSYAAKVSKNGEVTTSPYDYSQAYNVTASLTATAYNLIVPKQGFNFIITSITIYANRNVGANDATVELYESSVGPDSTTQSKLIFTTELLKQTRFTVSTNLLVSEGVWVNLETDDSTVFGTIMGYYIPTC